MILKKIKWRNIENLELVIAGISYYLFEYIQSSSTNEKIMQI